MNYIKINEGKLKITLEAKDLEDWDIQIDELDYANPCARAIFEEFLAYAKKNLGFDPNGHKVLIHLYPSRDGGCEIFISKLDEKREPEEERSSERAYSFEHISYLLGACRRLLASGASAESSAYLEKDGRCFLLLCSERDDLGFISEYGEEEDPESLLLYLGEYAEEICKTDAIEILGKI